MSEKPIQNLRQIHCAPGSFAAFVGDGADIKQLPMKLSTSVIMPETNATNKGILKRNLQIESALTEIEQRTPAAMELFCKDPRSWYYLGQRQQCTIHGPYKGIRMFSWFQRGWLSLDVPIWSTTESVTSIDTKRFRALRECLNPVY